MLFISDFKKHEIVRYNGTRAEITQIIKPNEICIKNLEFPIGDWISARLPYTEVEKIVVSK